MARLTDEINKAWENREPATVFTTVDEMGKPNAIYATCVSKFDDETIIVANNYFSKTLSNLLKNKKGSLLFITKNDKAYQIKGTIEYHKSGIIFEDMKKWNPKKHPGHGAVALKVEEVYKGSERLV